MSLVIGLDIGARGIKIAMVEKKRNIEVKWLDYIELQKGTLNDGELVDMEAVAYSLSDYFSSNKLMKIPVALCMSNSQIGTRTFKIQTVKDKVLDKAVLLEFYNQLGYSTEEYSISYKLSSKDKKETQGLIAYCPKKYVDDYRNLFGKMGLKLKYMDYNANSIAKFFEHMIAKNGEEAAVMLIDIGTDTSHISIVKEKNLVMSRSVINGGNDLDVIVADYLNVTVEEANQLKHDKYKIVYEQGKDLETHIQKAYEGIFREIEYTIDRFNEMYDYEISKIILLGGGSNLPSLNTYMKRHFNINTQLLMGTDVKSSFLADVHLYANAIGAAIRED